MSFHNNNINFYQSNLVRLSIKNNLNQIDYTYRSDVLNCVIHIIRNDIFFNELNQLNILDIGCKEGFIGEKIKKNNIICVVHGIETSLQKMEKAIQKDCYHRIFNLNIYENNFAPDRKYNLILISELFIEKNFSLNVIDLLSPHLKNKGLIIINISEEYKDKNIMDFNQYIINNTELVLISNIHIKEIDEDNYFYVILKKL